MSNTINLPIKRKWFDMILSGEKKEEYREFKPYWIARLLGDKNAYSDPWPEITEPMYFDNPKKIETLTLINGYGDDKPRIVVELLNIDLKQPNPAWCPPETTGLWFALGLGKIISVENYALPSKIRYKYSDQLLHLRTYEKGGKFTIEYTSDPFGNGAEIRCAVGSESQTTSELLTWFANYPQTYQMIDNEQPTTDIARQAQSWSARR